MAGSGPTDQGNITGSRDYFRWDDRHHQPHSDLSTWQKLWGSRADAAAFARLLGCNLRHIAPVLARYRQVLRRPRSARAVDATMPGVAISPTKETWPRYRELIAELGLRSVLLRVPVWAPDTVLGAIDELAELRQEGIALTFVLVQDRDAVRDPQRWESFVTTAVAALAPLQPTFQIGQVLNRKKWGIWLPDEYTRLVAGVAAARQSAPGCRFIGPPVIDFEYHFTINYLFRQRPFDFDGITSLLYVDRRGSPDATQYGHFDLEHKILLLQAIVEASPHPTVPLHLTEFNWPLKGAGAHSPAGRDVQTDELRQARYLALYYLTAAATGVVASAIWWQLVARGYGLLDDDWRQRPAYRTLATLLRHLPGATVSRLPATLLPLRGFSLERDGERRAVVYTTGPEVTLARPGVVLEARTLLDETVAPGRIGPDPLLLGLPGGDQATALEALALSR